MELIRTIRTKVQTKKQQEIQQRAEELITLSDFADNLFIAYQGVPLIPIDSNATHKDIIAELSKIRQNYVNSHLLNNQQHAYRS